MTRRDPHETTGFTPELVAACLAWDPFQAPPRTPLPPPTGGGHDEATWERISAAAEAYDPETDRGGVR